ncbi:MAG TPA: type II toxin-antitoxin system VapC family toxin [Burkholderiaceae bacterium]|nr:type II toxin-antitoxin system VapC family toxin [Burkholderiaceae bacterium]
MIYADTSVLASLYMQDANTPRAVALVRSLTQPLFYCALHRLEIRNAFALALFRGEQTQTQADAAWQNVEADLKAQVLVPVPVQWSAALRRSAEIAWAETPTLGSRSADILHVACAEQLRAIDFLSFDQRQRALAARLGFSVQP